MKISHIRIWNLPIEHDIFKYRKITQDDINSKREGKNALLSKKMRFAGTWQYY